MPKPTWPPCARWAHPPAAPGPIQADAFVQELTATARALCAPAGVQLAVRQSWHGTFTAQQTALARALENMIENAVRYTPKGGTVTLALAAAGQGSGSRLQFTVTDTGPGFSPEALQKAGQLLYTESPARPTGGHQGLGLYTARQTAAAHGGTLRLQNTPTGAAVTLELPLQPWPLQS